MYLYNISLLLTGRFTGCYCFVSGHRAIGSLELLHYMYIRLQEAISFYNLNSLSI